jgi:ABC-type dipeptide/oligopeptide/nickel transport system permease subunit
MVLGIAWGFAAASACPPRRGLMRTADVAMAIPQISLASSSRAFGTSLMSLIVIVGSCSADLGRSFDHVLAERETDYVRAAMAFRPR